jgi:hypothetical protein
VQKTLVLVGLAVLFAGVAFVGGFWFGSSRMERIKDHALAEYRGQLDRLGRDLEDARRAGQLVREGIGIAQSAIDDSTRGLEESLAGIGRLGTVTLQIRGLATAIRAHVEVIRAANTALETVGNRLDSFVDPVDLVDDSVLKEGE